MVPDGTAVPAGRDAQDETRTWDSAIAHVRAALSAWIERERGGTLASHEQAHWPTQWRVDCCLSFEIMGYRVKTRTLVGSRVNIP